jgi:ribosomal protein L11 methyltransferase
VTKTVRVRIEAPSGEWDRLIGELHGLGTLGVEERDSPDAPASLVAYFEQDLSWDAVRALGDPTRRVTVHEPEPEPDADWERGWRRGLEPRRVAGLWIRPSWCASRGEPELIVDPEQAFGTGEHATTRLALGLALEALRPGDRVLDFGTGSGILALATLRRGASRAFGFDVDPVACRCARRNAGRNGLDLALWCGSLDALAPDAGFELVLANELWSRVSPWLARLAAHARRALVVSGFLESERPAVVGALAALGLDVARREAETQGADAWGALVAVHAAARQSSSRSLKVSSKA